MKTKSKPKPEAGPLEARVVLDQAAEFPVRFTRDAFAARNPDLAEMLGRRDPGRRQRVAVVLDSGAVRHRPGLPRAVEAYAAAHARRLVLAGAPIVMDGGETAKARPQVVDWLRARLTGACIGARDHLVVVGGGAVLDAAGFAAATLHGGLRVTRVPTTLAAQAGAALSLDCAVHAFGRRDWTRAAQAPFGVLVDPRPLSSLRAREKRAGLAELALTGLALDADLFAWLGDHTDALLAFDRRAVETAARWSARARWERVADDPEAARAEGRACGFGRWAAYAVMARDRAGITFGEACGVGAAVDVLLSVLVAGFPAEPARAALETLARLGLPLWHDALAERDDEGFPAILAGLTEKREREGGGVGVPLLRGLGRAETSDAVTAEAVEAAVDALSRWSPA